MKSKPLMLLLVAAGCGLVAMIGVQQMLSNSKPAPKIRIAVAKEEIQAGVKLDETNVTVKELPPEAVPEGAVTKTEEFAERALKHRLAAGQPILLSELGQRGEYGINIQIPSDMRLASVPCTATMTHSGLLKPGSFVDINAAVEIPIKGGGRRTEVKPVLQCIQVFAIDSLVAGAEESKETKGKEVKNVTFLMYPLQAQLLHLAYKQSNGGLQITSRNSLDKKLVNAGDLDDQQLSMLSNALMGIQDEPDKKDVAEKPAAVVKPRNAFRNYVAPETTSAMTTVGDQAARRTWKIEIYHGDQKEVHELDWPEDERAEDSQKKVPEEAANPWTNPLMKFFNRREKAAAAAPVDAQSTSLIRREDTAESVDQGSNDQKDSPSVEKK